MRIQNLIDQQLEKLLDTAIEEQVPVNEFLGSLREQTSSTPLFWWLVERMYQLAYNRGVFLNSESIIKVYRQPRQIDADSVTYVGGSDTSLSENEVLIDEKVELSLGTVGKCLQAAGLDASVRALAYELIAADGEVSFFLEAEGVDCQEVGSFPEVCKQEMRERLTADYVWFN